MMVNGYSWVQLGAALMLGAILRPAFMMKGYPATACLNYFDKFVKVQYFDLVISGDLVPLISACTNW